MTPAEALAQALDAEDIHYPLSAKTAATVILAALPEGWTLTPPESGKPRPRRDCPVCRRKAVAVMADGSLWWHKWPGWSLWSDGGDCKGAP